jgi:hypothetical protein
MRSPAPLSVEIVGAAPGRPKGGHFINPTGSGPSMVAQLACDKIGRAF